MKYQLLLHTLGHLRPTQVFHQVKSRVLIPNYRLIQCPTTPTASMWAVTPIPRPKCTDGDKFSFINIISDFTTWNDSSRGMLWAYNQNYFDFINQSGTTKEYGLYWINKFIRDLSTNKVGLDPYPTALRGINWIKFFGRYPETLTKEISDCLFSQYRYLQKRLEYHILGNHLLEDFYSLFIMSLYFEDHKYHLWATNKLINELQEEILMDGGHFEQSVMYHCILLDRLLDCICFAVGMGCLYGINELKSFANRMLGWLREMCWKDGSFPLFNDAAIGIAPLPDEIFNYANRLGIEPVKVNLSISGYRRFANELIEAIVDVGGITATYQPGHSHADTFNYELRINGKPFVVDTGISTYNKTARRQYERSTEAHNTVTINGKDSSEVWGGFRVSRRARINDITCITANGDIHKRQFVLTSTGIIITDIVSAPAVSRIHLSPDVTILECDNNIIHTNLADIKITGAQSIKAVDCMVSTEYNKFHNTKCIEISFDNQLQYTIEHFNR